MQLAFASLAPFLVGYLQAVDCDFPTVDVLTSAVRSDSKTSGGLYLGTRLEREMASNSM